MPRPASEPIAIVGMACRFPGANDIEAFWRLLEAGVNAVTEGAPGSGTGRAGQLFPDDKVAGACRFAGFLDRLDEFDASFFRISPVEAQRLDPQQRMMLETSWQALEDAGIDPDRLRGSRTGVYAGISNYDYRALVLEAGEPTEPAASLYSVTGTSFNTAIGRVAFALGLNGPAMALDTACSSSLVAIHQAVSGLQREEADLALAGGVHVILSAQLFEMRANAGMLSPDGRCATFDAGANGYVRGEGCGILVLKRLSEAVADGDRIWAVIRSTAVNQDGATPGLTVPSEEAQEQCIGDALRRAGLSPEDVDYVEAHGTGTEVGDPIEARATAAAYGKGRAADRPLLIGSVKTNIGHLEAAAGVAGVIKAVLSMGRRTIPKHLHFNEPSPQIDWDRIPLRVAGERMEWPLRSGRLPLAGVSGFGWSGTNAHVLLEGHAAGGGRALPVEVPLAAEGAGGGALRAPRGDELAARVTRILPLSGRSEETLRDLAQRYLDWVDEGVGEASAGGAGSSAGDPLLSDMAWTAGVGRSHFDHRAGVVFRDGASLREGLRAVASPEEGPRTELRPGAGRKIAFAYGGQASQWPGMGAALYASEPVVRAVLDRCDDVLREQRDASLLDVMFGRPAAVGELDDPRWKQPAIYALECALAALWSSLGIRPDVVLGHSLGEIAAAHAAGVFGLEDGLRLAAVRGELVGALPGEGAMGAVFAPAVQVAEELEEHNATSHGIGLCIAADNGAHQVISGPAVEVSAMLERLEATGIRVARLRKSPAYHSAMIEPALDDLEDALARLSFAAPSLPFISNLTGRTVGSDEALDAGYWRRQMRAPVAFRACVETLAGLGVDAVVEIGPHSVLGPMTTLAWPGAAGTPAPPLALSSLKRPGRNVSATEAEDAFFAAVAGAYEAGLQIRFDGLFAGESRRRISLPGYPFRRDRYWIDAPRRRRSSADHPLLGSRHESASGEISFDTELFPSDPAWLGDHRVFDRVVAPGALHGAMAASACSLENPGPAVVEDFQMQSALVFPERDGGDGSEEEGRRLQVLLDGAAEDGSRRVRILSRGAADEEWTLHAEGRVSTGDGVDPAPLATSPPLAGSPPRAASPDLARLRTDLAPVDLPAYYRAKAEVGIDLGPSFRTLEALWAGPGEALGEVSLPDSAGRAGLAFHPLALDGCFQVMGAARETFGSDDDVTYLPFGWERLSVPEELPQRVLCHVLMREAPDGAGAELPEVLSADIALYEFGGSRIGTLTGYTVKRATRSALLPAVEGVEELLYEVVWRDSALPPGMPAADFLPQPSAAASRSLPFSRYLAAEGVEIEDETDLQVAMERVSWCYALSALETLGWERRAGAAADPEELRERLGVLPEHGHLLRRMIEILARSGVLRANGGGFVVTVGTGDPLPDEMPRNVESFLRETEERLPHATNEIGLFRRCAGALPEVLRGKADPLSLLFGDAEPTAADLYRRAAVWRAANRMLGEVVGTLVDELPADRRLRVLEVGAGIGSATEYVLPELAAGRFDYMYTDISAGFFAEAEARFSGEDASIDYRVLDIEKDPIDQGFDGTRLRPRHRGQRPARHAPSGRDAGPLPGAAGAVGAAGGAREPARQGLDGSDIRTAGRMVALRRSLPREPRACGTRGVATGAHRYGLCRIRGSRPGSAGSGRPAGSRGDRGAGSRRDRLAGGRLGTGRRSGRNGGGAGDGTGGPEPACGAGGRRSGGPCGGGDGRGRRRCGRCRDGAARVVAIARRRPTFRCAVRRRGAPRRTGRPRCGGDNRGHRGGCEAGGGERARACAGHRGRGCRARQRRVARHPRGAGARTGTDRATGRRPPLGLRQGGGAGGAADATADDRPRPRGSAAARSPRGRSAVSRCGKPHRASPGAPAGGPARPGGRRRGAPCPAGRCGLGAGARRGRGDRGTGKSSRCRRVPWNRRRCGSKSRLAGSTSWTCSGPWAWSRKRGR